jgi:hypothetical protein
LIRADDSPERRRHARLAAKGEMWICLSTFPGLLPTRLGRLGVSCVGKCIGVHKAVKVHRSHHDSLRSHTPWPPTANFPRQIAPAEPCPHTGVGDGDGISVGENVAVTVAGARLLASSRPGTPYTYFDIPIWRGLPRVDSNQATLARTAPTQTKCILAVDGWNLPG